MARIIDPAVVHVDFVQPSTHIFEVSYTLLFDADEIGLKFDEDAKLWEDDSNAPFGGGDDAVTAYQQPPRRFTATDRVMDRTFRVDASDDQVDTESGNEEIYAQIWLRRVGHSAADSEVKSGAISVNT
jgi:hypothetical protein